MKRQDRYAVPPTVLFSDADDRTETLKHIHAMFHVPGGVDNSKFLEDIHRHWEYFKAARGLPVIPPRMKLTSAGTRPLRFDPNELTYSFHPSSMTFSAANVLHRDHGIDEGFKGVESSTFYCPKNAKHRGFESMCVASIRGVRESEVLCLFQSKTKSAVEGLNIAANDLEKQRWREGQFLFIVVALAASERDIDAAKKVAKHPTLIVNRSSLADYFTATLSPAVELCLSRHESTKVNADTTQTAHRE